MRRFVLTILAVAACAAGGASVTSQAQAGWDHYPAGYDPYFYYPSNRGYYPYYNSGQWRSAREMRYRRRLARRHFYYPQYNPAWGHPVMHYRHREWHKRHHGRHHIGHW